MSADGPISAPGVERPDFGRASSATAEEARLRVRVEDREGGSIEGATVQVGAVTGTTDDAGDASLTGLVAGDEAVVMIRADGYLTLVRRVEALGVGLNRLSVALTPLTDAVTGEVSWADTADSASGTVLVSDEDFTVELPAPDALVYETGEPFEGDSYTYTLLGYETSGLADDDAMDWSPGPLLASSDDDEKDGLESLGMFSLELTDPGTGLVLQPGTQPVGVTRTFPLADYDERDPDVPEWWYLDLDQGTWAPYADEGVEGELTVGDDGDWLATVELPHLCVINLDIRRTSRCLTVHTPLDASLQKDAQLHVVGLGIDQTYAIEGSSTLLNVPSSKLRLELLLYDNVVATTSVEKSELGTRDGASCSDRDTPLTLGDTGWMTEASGSMIVRVRTGDCPATVHHIVATPASGGDPQTADLDSDESLAVFSGLDAGTWTLQAYGGDDGETALTEGGSATAVIEGDEPTLVTLDVDGATAMVPDGGCEPLPCEGDACDSALTVTLSGTSGAVQGSVELSGMGRYRVPSSGTCIPLPGLAGQEMTVRLPSTVGATRVELPAGGSCGDASSLDDDTGARVDLLRLSTCDPDATEELSSAWLGPSDPRFFDEDTLALPSWVEPGAMMVSELEITDGALAEDEVDPLQSLFSSSDDCGTSAPSGVDELISGIANADAWAWEGWTQDGGGGLTSSGLHLRAVKRGCSDGPGLRLDIGVPLEDLLKGGVWSWEELEDELEDDEDLRATLAHAPDLAISGGGYDLPAGLRFGALQIASTATGEHLVTFTDVMLTLDSAAVEAGFTPIERTYEIGTLSWTVPLAGPAPTTTALSDATTHTLFGAGARRSDQAEISYGPPGSFGKIDVCLPMDETVYHLKGDAYPDAIPGITPLLTWDEAAGGVTMAAERVGGVEEGAGGWSSPWVDLGVEPGELLAQFGSAVVINKTATWTPPEGVAKAGARPPLFDTFQAVRVVYARHSLTVTSTGNFAGASGRPGGGLSLSVEQTMYSQAQLNAEWAADLSHRPNIGLGGSRTTTIAVSGWSPTTLYQVDRAWLLALYAQEGLSDVSPDDVGTVLVGLDLCTEDSCTLRVEPPGGDAACFVGGAPSEAETAPAPALFFGLDPGCATADEPYWWLVWEDSTGAQLRVPFVVEPGTALVLR